MIRYAFFVFALVAFSGCSVLDVEKSPEPKEVLIVNEDELRKVRLEERDNYWDSSLYSVYNSFSKDVDNIFSRLDTSLLSMEVYNRNKNQDNITNLKQAEKEKSGLYFSEILYP